MSANKTNVSIEDRAKFDFVRYANCWEDTDILCEALVPAPGKRVLSIASAGDNAFALAGMGAEVIACDLNPAQLACANLKAVAIQELKYEEVLQFFGILSADNRIDIYQKLKPGLVQSSRDFWDSRLNVIRTGFIHDGKFEKYFTLFKRWILPMVASRTKVKELFTLGSLAEQRSFYDNKWNTWRWRLIFKLFFSRFVMGQLGRDPEFFRYVQGSVSDRILERTRYAFTEIFTANNPYLYYILNGNYDSIVPRYLRQELFASTRDGTARTKLVLGPIQQGAKLYGQSGFDAYNLSDIFEYLNPELSAEIYGELLKTARPSARLAYWNMLVPRSAPAAYSRNVRPLTELAKKLFLADQAFFYSAFVVDEVIECLQQ